jgi:hypothetical protein
MVELPRGKAAWDTSVKPALPEWVKIRQEGRIARSRPDHRMIPWAPELSFVAELERVDELDTLLRIQRFFSDGGRSGLMVPVRERSVSVLGDEKRLEQLARTALFGPGRLSYELLRCFPVAPPLVWEAGPRDDTSRIILVIENHHTWHSFCRWNQEVGAYAAIVYGAGNAFASSVEYLVQVMADTGAQEVHYFGDLDPEGLHIVQRAQERLKSQFAAKLPDIRPAVDWYRLLIERGQTVLGVMGEVVPSALDSPPEADPSASHENSTNTRGAVEQTWLPLAIHNLALGVFAQGRRLPQELVGWEQLKCHTRSF